MNGCRGKIRYRDKLGAMVALSSAARKSHKGKRNESRLYHCGECGGWHLTSVHVEVFRAQKKTTTDATRPSPEVGAS